MEGAVLRFPPIKVFRGNQCVCTIEYQPTLRGRDVSAKLRAVLADVAPRSYSLAHNSAVPVHPDELFKPGEELEVVPFKPYGAMYEVKVGDKTTSVPFDPDSFPQYAVRYACTQLRLDPNEYTYSGGRIVKPRTHPAVFGWVGLIILLIFTYEYYLK